LKGSTGVAGEKGGPPSPSHLSNVFDARALSLPDKEEKEEEEEEELGLPPRAMLSA
jgi:hypothetical protein